MIRHINSNPLPRYRNASDLHDDDEQDVSVTGLSKQQQRKRRVKREDISAALSQNITMILEDLLKDYDKTERPSFKQGQATKVKINILIRSMGPISEEDMVNNIYYKDLRSLMLFSAVCLQSQLISAVFLCIHLFYLFQNYSMDCYFRQYWRDERLGFTGPKKNTNKLSINQLSLNVKMLEKIWKPDTYFHNGLSSYLHTITRPNKLLRISEHGDITYSMR